MKFSFRQYLLNEGITDGVKAVAGAFMDGYDRGKTHGEEALQKKADLKKAEEEKQKKEELKKLTKDLNAYIKTMFTNFPNTDNGVQDLLQQYESFQSADFIFKFFKESAEIISKLTKEMNTTLVNQRKVSRPIMDKIKSKADEAVSGALPEQLIAFAKKEADFFTRLLTLEQDEYTIDQMNFKHLLAAKIKATDGERVQDAAMALNILFAYVTKAFTSNAAVVGETARKRKKEEEEKAEKEKEQEQKK